MVRFLLPIVLLMSPPSDAAGMNDDPVLTMLKLDKFEKTDFGTSSDTSWELQAWLGKDLDKVWFKTEGELVNNHLEHAETQLLYSRAIAPTWDLQLGWRHDIKPTPTRDWLAFGIQGLAPYFFESELHLFVAENGNINGRAKFEYDMLLSQKLILTPELEANIFSKSDQAIGIGQGLSEIDFGLRLRYEISRKFAPYIGINWTKQFNKTADISRQMGEDSSEFQWVAGVRAWW